MITVKSDVRIWRSSSSGRVYIGNRAIKFELPSDLTGVNLESVIQEFKRDQIEWELLEPRLEQQGREVIENILLGMGLVDSITTPVHYLVDGKSSKNIHEKCILSVPEENFYSRVRIEANGITRTGNSRDGGFSQVLKRRNFGINIFGEGRLATSLFGLLVSSGFDNCTVVQRDSRSASKRQFAHRTSLNKSSDLMGGFLQQSDIGFSASESLYNLRQGSRLYCEEFDTDEKVDLVVCLGRPYPEMQMEWLENRTPQIFAELITQGDLRIGPYVSGNVTTCFSCINLTEIDSGYPLTMLLDSATVDIPVALAAAGAGIIALEISKIADSQLSSLNGATATINMQNFLEPQITKWHRHPGCGCHKGASGDEKMKLSTRAASPSPREFHRGK